MILRLLLNFLVRKSFSTTAKSCMNSIALEAAEIMAMMDGADSYSSGYSDVQMDSECQRHAYALFGLNDGFMVT